MVDTPSGYIETVCFTFLSFFWGRKIHANLTEATALVHTENMAIERYPKMPCPQYGGNIQYPWKEMEIGDWFVIYTDEIAMPYAPESTDAVLYLQQRLSSACHHRQRRHKERYRTRIDRTEHCVYVFRVPLPTRRRTR